jgi:hypothetical protein
VSRRLPLNGSAAKISVFERSVMICTHTEWRSEQIGAALGSVSGQNPTPVQVILGVDHNPDSAVRARREFSRVTVLENDRIPGLWAPQTRDVGLPPSLSMPWKSVRSYLFPRIILLTELGSGSTSLAA